MYYANQIDDDRYFRLTLVERLANLREQIKELKDILAPTTATDRPTTGLTFGDALWWLKQGNGITRKCWRNPRVNVWLWDAKNCPGAADNALDELRVNMVNGKQAPWTPNHQELLADDWEVVK